MRRSLALCTAALLALLWSPPVGTGQEPSEGTTTGYPKAILSKPFTPTLGDMIALSTSELVTALKGTWDAPTIAIFDRDAKKIAIIIYGTKSSLDGAKESVDEMRKGMQPRLEMIGNLYHVTMDESDLAYVYYHAQKELVRWEDGKYTVGGE